jgi:8-oxo-dGTP diphosphatase
VVYYGFVDYKKSTVHASDDAAAVNWFSLKNLPALAFDHDLIIGKLLEKIQLS